MTTTYRDIVVQEAYRDSARTHNVCANGEGENPIDVAHEDQEWQERMWREINAKRARNAANAAQVAEWNTGKPLPSIRTCDGVAMCADCPMLNTEDCAEYQRHLGEVGRGNDYVSVWNQQTAERAGAFSPRCDY